MGSSISNIDDWDLCPCISPSHVKIKFHLNSFEGQIPQIVLNIYLSNDNLYNKY